MFDFLLERSTVISLAVIGGGLSVLASWCAARQTISDRKVKWLNKAAYGVMGISMVLFICAGLFAGEK